jgi:hypothetical protein
MLPRRRPAMGGRLCERIVQLRHFRTYHITESARTVRRPDEDQWVRQCVILEYQLAMEIRHRKRLRAIYPIFVGEKAPADIACDFYTDFFVGKNGGLPSCNDEVVEAIDKKLREHVFRHFQGGPWLPSSSRTVATTLTEICQYQGFRFMGMEDNVLKLVMDRHTPLYSAILRYTPCSSFLACKLSRILGRL